MTSHGSMTPDDAVAARGPVAAAPDADAAVHDAAARAVSSGVAPCPLAAAAAAAAAAADADAVFVAVEMAPPPASASAADAGGSMGGHQSHCLQGSAVQCGAQEWRLKGMP